MTNAAYERQPLVGGLLTLSEGKPQDNPGGEHGSRQACMALEQ